MRNKLFTQRLEICLTKDQVKIVKELAKKQSKTMNEVIRQAIMDMWENI